MAPCSRIQHCVGIPLSGRTRCVLRERKGLAEILLWFHFKTTMPGADSGGRESAPLLHFVTQLTTGWMTPRRFLQINKHFNQSKLERVLSRGNHHKEHHSFRLQLPGRGDREGGSLRAQVRPDRRRLSRKGRRDWMLSFRSQVDFDWRSLGNDRPHHLAHRKCSVQVR